MCGNQAMGWPVNEGWWRDIFRSSIYNNKWLDNVPLRAYSSPHRWRLVYP